MITDPTLLPPVFDRMNYPPNTDTLDRPVDQMLHKLDAVCACLRSCPSILPAATLLARCAGGNPKAPLELLMWFGQVLSDCGSPSLLTGKTGSELWRLVRKGIAPSFNPQNIRWALASLLISEKVKPD